jgi:fructose-bisphosphate aldolase class II
VLVDLTSVIGPARGGRGVAAFNVFGYEDARAVIDAAEALRAPVILAANADLRRFMPLALIATMFRALADRTEVPVCAHLDHGHDIEEIRRAIDVGFTSVMFDGSQRPIAENIEITSTIVRYARAAGVSVEGEVGSVPYAEGRPGIAARLTTPEEAGRFAQATGVDALAVAVGNVQRMRDPGANLDFPLFERIAATIATPLVIHGASGVSYADLTRLVKAGAAKFNIGTALRQSFGRGLRAALAAQPDAFDRIEIMRPVIDEMTREATRQLRRLGWGAEIGSGTPAGPGPGPL